MRWILALIAVVVLLIAAGAVYVFTNLDAIVEAAIEKYGSELTETRVSVGGVDISLTDGRGTLTGIEIANPDGYDAENAFSLGEITLDIDPESVTGSPIVIDAVIVAAPEVTYEMNTALSSNIQDLLDNIQRQSSGGAKKSEAPAEGGEEVLLRIRRFEFRDGRLAADTRAAGGKQVELKLPPFTMTDVGGANGAPAGKIGAEVLQAYGQSVVQTVARSEIDKQVKKGTKKVKKEAKKALEGLFD